MIRSIAAVLPTLLVVSIVLGADPTSQPGERNPAMADSFYQAAKSATTPEAAMAAVNKALEYDPAHLMAGLLRAELLLNGQQGAAAVAEFDTIKAAMARLASVPADAKTKAKAIQDRIDALSKCKPRWVALKQQFADRYIALGEELATPGLPSTAMAFTRACHLKADDAELVGRRDRAMAAAPTLPAPAAKPDPAGAKILHDQAAAHLGGLRYDQALDSLKTAIALDPNQPDWWCDLGACYLKGKDKNGLMAAACLVEAKKKVGSLDEDAGKKLSVRVTSLLVQADPKMARLQSADDAFAAVGKQLRDDAEKAGDKITADQVVSAVYAVTGQSIGKAGSGSLAQGDWINVLNMVWPRKDGGVYWYDFVWGGDGLMVRPGYSCPHLAFPVTVEGDYELRAEWEVTADKADKAEKTERYSEFDLPVGLTTAKLNVGEAHSGLSLVGKNWNAKDNPTLASTPKSDAGKTVQLAVSVKVAGKSARIVAQLDNRPLVRWEGLISALGDPDTKAACPGIGLPVRAIVHRFDMRSTRGKIQPIRRMDPFVSGPGDLAGKIDLASRDIEIVLGYGQKPTDQKVTQARDHVVIQRLVEKSAGRIRLTLGNLMFAESSRLVVCVETDGACDVAFGPGWGREEDNSIERVGAISLLAKGPDNWVTVYPIATFLKSAGCEVVTAPNDKLVEAANADGVYTVCFEQFGKTQNAWVNSTKVLEATLPDELVKQAPHLPMNLWVTVVKGQKVKVTLRELMISKSLPAYLPPAAASQPDSANEPKDASKPTDAPKSNDAPKPKGGNSLFD